MVRTYRLTSRDSSSPACTRRTAGTAPTFLQQQQLPLYSHRHSPRVVSVAARARDGGAAARHCDSSVEIHLGFGSGRRHERTQGVTRRGSPESAVGSTGGGTEAGAARAAGSRLPPRLCRLSRLNRGCHWGIGRTVPPPSAAVAVAAASSIAATRCPRIALVCGEQTHWQTRKAASPRVLACARSRPHTWSGGDGRRRCAAAQRARDQGARPVRGGGFLHL